MNSVCHAAGRPATAGRAGLKTTGPIRHRATSTARGGQCCFSNSSRPTHRWIGRATTGRSTNLKSQRPVERHVQAARRWPERILLERIWSESLQRSPSAIRHPSLESQRRLHPRLKWPVGISGCANRTIYDPSVAGFTSGFGAMPTWKPLFLGDFRRSLAALQTVERSTRAVNSPATRSSRSQVVPGITRSDSSYTSP